MSDNDENDVDDDDDDDGRKDRKRRKRGGDKQPGGKRAARANIYTMKSHGPYDYRSTSPNEGLQQGRRRKGRHDGGAKCNVDYRPLGRDSLRSERDARTRLPELRCVASAIALTSSEASLMERRLASSSVWILAEFRAVAAPVRRVSSDTKTSGHSIDDDDSGGLVSSGENSRLHLLVVAFRSLRPFGTPSLKDSFIRHHEVLPPFKEQVISLI